MMRWQLALLLILAACAPKIVTVTTSGEPCDATHLCGEGMGCSGAFEDASGFCILEQDAEHACDISGGEWGTYGLMQKTYCIRINTDAGNPCTDKADCKGACILNSETNQGECQRLETQFGCYTTLENGQPGPALCVD